MKNPPGNSLFSEIAIRFILLWVAASIAHGGDFTSKFSLSTTKPYVKEAVLMTLDLVQTDHSKVILFKFSPKKSDDYAFHRLDMKEEDAYHAAKVRYTYLIYPKRAGKISVTFNLIEMVTTDDKVAYSFSGDRDNVRGLNKTDIPIKLPPLELEVKALPKGTQIVGDFTMQHRLKKDHANAFEPIPFKITIKGKGYPPILKEIIPRSQDFSLFEEAPIVQSFRSTKGTQSSVVYSYALSAKKSFDLPEVSIKAFNPKSKKSYLLTIPSKHIAITQPKQAALVDKIDSPKPMESDWSWLSTLFGYLLVFIAGFATAKTLKWSRRTQLIPSPDPFIEAVNGTSDPKILLTLLMAKDAQSYSRVIKKLEKHLYSKGAISIKRIKQEIEAIADKTY